MPRAPREENKNSIDLRSHLLFLQCGQISMMFQVISFGGISPTVWRELQTKEAHGGPLLLPYVVINAWIQDGLSQIVGFGTPS